MFYLKISKTIHFSQILKKEIFEGRSNIMLFPKRKHHYKIVLKLLRNHHNLTQIIQNYQKSLKNSQKSSKFIRNHPNSSEIIKSHQKSLKTIRNYQNSSEIIRNRQKSIKIIRNRKKILNFQKLIITIVPTNSQKQMFLFETIFPKIFFNKEIIFFSFIFKSSKIINLQRN